MAEGELIFPRHDGRKYELCCKGEKVPEPRARPESPNGKFFWLLTSRGTRCEPANERVPELACDRREPSRVPSFFFFFFFLESAFVYRYMLQGKDTVLHDVVKIVGNKNVKKGWGIKM